MLKRIKAKFSRKIKAVHADPKKKTYPEELKKAIRKEVAKGHTKYEVAMFLGISYTLIHNWCK